VKKKFEKERAALKKKAAREGWFLGKFFRSESPTLIEEPAESGDGHGVESPEDFDTRTYVIAGLKDEIEKAEEKLRGLKKMVENEKTCVQKCLMKKKELEGV
jgi:hypothetical protein